MRSLIFIVWLLSSLSLLADTSLQQVYLGVYLEINDGQRRELDKDYLGALVRYQVAESFLARIQVLDPQWETALVSKRLQDCQKKVATLRPLGDQQLGALNNEWSLDAQALERQGGWADLDRAQAKLTFLEVMRDNHPELSKAGFDERILAATKIFDDLVNTALTGSRMPKGETTVQ